MIANRFMPTCDVIPVLAYADVERTVEWLCNAFSFKLRWRAGGHRAQLNVGSGCIVVTAGDPSPAGREIMVRVNDIDAHYTCAMDYGVEVTSSPIDFPYGERQYGARDLDGYRWSFSQSIADVDPASWGATVGTLTV